MKKTFNIKGMHCNSCVTIIENELKDKVKSISASYAKQEAIIDFDENKISEKEIIGIIKNIGYEAEEKDPIKSSANKKDWLIIGIIAILISLALLYKFTGFNLSNLDISSMQIPEFGGKTSLILLFIAGILTGFHCIAMCGGFVISYTAKNAIKGHKSFIQHLIYGGSKVISYTIIGGIFGLIGGLIAFSIGLRSWVAILAGIFMIFYALSMFGIAFFRRFQFNPKFLTKAASVAGENAKGQYKAPLITGLLNGLFIACGPLQAMYLYAAGTGSFLSGASSLMAFGLGTLPVMLGFGSVATLISHKTTKRILKFSAILVLILGLIMLNRGLTLMGSNLSFDSIKNSITGGNSAILANSLSSNINNGIQEINMDVTSSGYSPNSFVLKKGIPVKWNVNVKQLTGCNSELISNEYNIDSKLKQGINVFEFTPDKTGTFTFSCGMGMLRGSFIVTETGEATQKQITASAVKSSSGTCNMGSGGSCGGGCGGASGSGGGCGCGG